MRSLFLFLFLVYSTFSMAQVNRYDTPAQAIYGNTYVSLNYDALLQLGALAKQKRMKIRELIQKSLSTYNSYPRYPNKIKEGWHQAIWLCQNEDLLVEVKAYVNNNNEITAVDFGTQSISDIEIKIVNGRAQTGDYYFYFFEDIWQYNKDYEAKQAQGVERQRANINTNLSAIGFAKIKSDYFKMLDILVLRSMPNPNSFILYRLQKSDLTERIQVIEDGEFYVKVNLKGHIGYISRTFLTTI